MIQFLIDNKVVLLGALLAISEALALIPAIKSNSIVQLIISSIKKMLGK